jgi:Ricin-type beta-trefoil lectin domain/Putative Ig domain/Subtilase family
VRIRTLAVATSSLLALATLLATVAAARTSAPPGPDFRHACSAPQPGWAGCLALERTNVVAYAGILRAAAPAGYSPAALQSAYSLTQASATAGRGQTVAVVDAFHDPDAAANLAVYRAQYHLPPCTTASGCLRQVNQNGAASPLPRPAGTTGWAAEEAVDLDTVSAICPNCHIIVVEANNGAAPNLGAAVNAAVSLGARFVSNSYSFAETARETAYDAYYDHPGVAVTASSGDSGYGTAYPAASRYVTSVGGTSLVRAPGTARGWRETVWNDFGATGSGCSGYEAKPAWQTDPGCPRRTENDVAADADPNTGVAVYDTYGQDRGWEVFGGTSVASPIIAATYALAGPPGAGATPAEYPYQHTGHLYDVTSGSDGSCAGSYLCTARVGYDGPTGWGTPDGTGAFAAVDNVITVASPGARRSRQGVKIAPMTIAARDSDSAQALRFTATGLPPGLSIGASGSVSGTPRAWGYYRPWVYATDGTGITASASFAWAVTSVGAITSRLAGQCLDDWHGGTVSARIDIYRCNHGRAQVWQVMPQPNGTVQLGLVKAASRACVTSSRWVTLQRCTSLPGQEWRFRGGNLISARSGLCLTDPGAGPSGTPLDLTRCSSAAAERWRLP